MELFNLIVALIVVIIVGPLLNFAYKRWKFVSTINKIPGPKSYPLIGTSWQFFGLKREDIFTVFRERDTKWPGICRSWNAFVPEIRLSKPEYVEKILSPAKNLTKSYGYTLELSKWLGQGLVTSSGEYWHSHRKVITPTFHFTILEGFVDVFAEKCQILVDKLAKHCNTNEPVDIFPLISFAALDIICATAMGIEMNHQETGESEYLKAVQRFAENGVQRLINPLLHINYIFDRTKYGKESRRNLKILHSFTDKVITERKQKRKEEEKLRKEESSFEDVGKKRRLAFLDLLLEETEKRPFFTDKDIREEVDTFVFAGHDTTTMSTCWALFLIGHHPEVQEQLYEELQTVYADSNTLPTHKDLGDLKYMERVMKECLRIYPTVFQVGRTVSEEFEVGGYTIPVGAMVTASIWGCSRDARHFPEPEKFDPDRFLPEFSQNRHPFAHIPFSAGPRNCIGQKFAQLEEKVLLSMILRNYKIKSVDSREDVKPIPEIVVRPYPGIRLLLQKRV